MEICVLRDGGKMKSFLVFLVYLLVQNRFILSSATAVKSYAPTTTVTPAPTYVPGFPTSFPSALPSAHRTSHPTAAPSEVSVAIGYFYRATFSSITTSSTICSSGNAVAFVVTSLGICSGQSPTYTMYTSTGTTNQ